MSLFVRFSREIEYYTFEVFLNFSKVARFESLQKVEDGILPKRNQASPNDCYNLARYNYQFNVLSFIGLNFFLANEFYFQFIIIHASSSIPSQFT